MSENTYDKSSRGVSVRVKTAKRRTISSSLWLKRQLNDPYVVKARKEGYRSRAAYKLIEINEKHEFLKKGLHVVDLGAAPGGWSQVAVERVGFDNVIGLDLLEVPAVAGANIFQMDFMDDDAPAKLKELMPRVDIVLSDMAPNASGQPNLDHLRIILLVEAAFDFACEVLSPNGVFVAKVWQGGTEHKLLEKMKQYFTTVKHVKPKASRQDSAETFVVAQGFRGQQKNL